jgi:hypothetical protein
MAFPCQKNVWKQLYKYFGLVIVTASRLGQGKYNKKVAPYSLVRAQE